LAFSAGQINLDWIASSDNISVTEYRVERCQGIGCTNFTVIATLGAVTSHIDTVVTPATSYTYRVRSVDGAGNVGPYSNTASAITPNISGYQYHRQITINAGKAPTPQSNFPVLISGAYPYLATVANGGKVQSPTGIDIKFTSDAAGTNVLPYEQERYVASTGQIAYWVKLPLVADAATFYIFHGHVRAVDQYNKAGVWDSNFKRV